MKTSPDDKQTKKPDIKVEELTRERDEYKGKYLRALADYQNLEKRALDMRQEAMRDGVGRLLLKLLPFLDHLEKAELFVKDSGLQMIKIQFLTVLKEAGLVELDVLNKPFDPFTSEAIEVVKGEKDDIVIQVVEKGYSLGDKILRVAKVKVSKI